ncbi:MAG: LuxR C-terminal-related transcriptional regulator [Lacunisphaera sp.]
MVERLRAQLSPRELDVLRLVGQGLSNKEIAAQTERRGRRDRGGDIPLGGIANCRPTPGRSVAGRQREPVVPKPRTRSSAGRRIASATSRYRNEAKSAER